MMQCKKTAREQVAGFHPTRTESSADRPGYDPEEETPVKAGNGSCMSCYPTCKGYRPGPNSYCSTPGCGHSFSMHH